MKHFIHLNDFSKQEISVPVKYTLLADGINISVDPNKITENEEYIYRIILSPFFASAEGYTVRLDTGLVTTDGIVSV